MSNRQVAMIIICVLSVFMLGLVTYKDWGNAVKLDDDLVTGTIDLAASSAQYTLPVSGEAYEICARGNRAYVECGANPTVTTSAGGYTFSVPDGSCVGPWVLTGPKCAHIAVTAVGQIEFLHFNTAL